VDDVHPPADAPAGPGDAAGRIEHPGVRLVELDVEVVEDRLPEPFGLGDRAGEEVIEVAQAVAIDERLQPAAGEVVGRWPPGDLAAEGEGIAAQGG
jgi:hypothetical protein